MEKLKYYICEKPHMRARTTIKILEGHEGDIVLKTSLTNKLIILKGLKLSQKEKIANILTIEIVEELLSKALEAGLLKERPHCIVIYRADVLLQQILSTYGVEVEVISNVKESIGAAHYAYTFYDFEKEEVETIEPFQEDPEITKYVEEIEGQLTTTIVEERSQENEDIVEIVIYDKGTYKYKTVPKEKLCEYEEIERKVIRIITTAVIKTRNDPRKHDYSNYITINVRVSHIKELEVNKSYRAKIKIIELGIEKESIITVRARRDEKGAKYITMMIRIGRKGEVERKVRVEIEIDVSK